MPEAGKISRYPPLELIIVVKLTLIFHYILVSLVAKHRVSEMNYGLILESQDCSITIGSGFRLDDWDSIPDIGKGCIFSPPWPDRFWGPPTVL
jgi:hypothetical protein